MSIFGPSLDKSSSRNVEIAGFPVDDNSVYQGLACVRADAVSGSIRSQSACLLSSEKKQKDRQYEIDDRGRTSLRKAFHPGHEEISEHEYIPTRENQNRER